VSHPDLEQLTAFGHGKLSDTENRAIAVHLVGCTTCQALLDTLPDDALLALIRPLFTRGEDVLPAGGPRKRATPSRFQLRLPPAEPAEVPSID
jgi:hypothetical protein